MNELTSISAASAIVRWAKAQDIPWILVIDGERADAISERELRQLMEAANTIVLVVEPPERNELLGYIVYTLRTNRIEIRRLCIATEYRRHGLATRLIEKMKGKLTFRRQKVTMAVSYRDLPTHLFLRSQKFSAAVSLVDPDLYVFTFYGERDDDE